MSTYRVSIERLDDDKLWGFVMKDTEEAEDIYALAHEAGMMIEATLIQEEA